MSINITHNPSTVGEYSTNALGIGTYHLADHPNLYEIQRTNNFEFIIDADKINSLTKLGSNTSFGTGEDSPADIIRISVESFPIPYFHQRAITIRRGNNQLKYAGIPEFDNASLVLKDFIGVETADILVAWQARSYNVLTEKVGLVEDYKMNCTVIEYSPDYQVVRAWDLKGCWISNLRQDDMSNENNNAVKITATIEFDSCRPNTNFKADDQ